MKEKLGILAINLVFNNHGLTKIHVVWAYPLVHLYNINPKTKQLHRKERLI